MQELEIELMITGYWLNRIYSLKEELMVPQDLLNWIRATPFVPFRIRLNSGRDYEIRHPEMVRVGLTTMNIYTFNGEPVDPYHRLEMMSLALIEALEPLEAHRVN